MEKLEPIILTFFYKNILLVLHNYFDSSNLFFFIFSSSSFLCVNQRSSFILRVLRIGYQLACTSWAPPDDVALPRRWRIRPRVGHRPRGVCVPPFSWGANPINPCAVSVAAQNRRSTRGWFGCKQATGSPQVLPTLLAPAVRPNNTDSELHQVSPMLCTRTFFKKFENK